MRLEQLDATVRGFKTIAETEDPLVIANALEGLKESPMTAYRLVRDEDNWIQIIGSPLGTYLITYSESGRERNIDKSPGSLEPCILAFQSYVMKDQDWKQLFEWDSGASAGPSKVGCSIQAMVLLFIVIPTLFLFVGGCALIGFFALSVGSDTPEYANEAYFESYHGDDFAILRDHLSGRATKATEELVALLSEDILAVFEDNEGSFNDVYKKFRVEKGYGEFLINGIGTTELYIDDIEELAVVREIEVDGITYMVCFRMRNDPPVLGP